MRIIEFSDGFTSSSAPSAVSAAITTNFLAATGATFKDKNAGITYLGGFRVANYDDPTKVIDIDIAGATALKKTTLAFNQTLDRVVSFPNATTTLLGHDSAQVITNKDIDGGTASNTNRITVPKDTLANLTALTRKEGTLVYATDTDKFYRDDGSALSEIGSGSGSSINYISNPDAESSTTGWSTYDDGAATPVDGTGGTVTTTLTRSTSSPLRGVASFLITTTAANLLGEGVAVDFTISNADLAKVLNISFDYSIASGTYVTGDFTVYIIQDPSGTPTVIQPTPYQLQALTVGLPGKFQATFQTSSTITTYRLLIHRAVSTSSACTIKLDNVVVGPQIQLYGAPIGDWTSFTPNGSWSTNVTYSGYRRRVGDSEEFSIVVTGTGSIGTPGNLTINLPVTANTSKLAAGTGVQPLGIGISNNAGVRQCALVVEYESATSVAVRYDTSSSPTELASVTHAAPDTFASGDTITLLFKVPVVGYSSTVLMSNDTDTRVVTARANRSGSQSLSNTTYTKIQLNNVGFDTHGAFDSATNYRYTAQVPGYYLVTGSIRFAVNATGSRYVNVYKNGSLSFYSQSGGYSADETVMQTTDRVFLNAGDYLELYGYQSSGGSLNVAGDINGTYLSVNRISGPSAIAATEKVYVLYVDNGGQSLTADVTNTTFSTKVFDSHGAWSGTVFTAPRAGWYDFKGNVSVSSSINTDWRLWINGVSKLAAIGTTDAVSQRTFGPFSYYMNAGDTAAFRVSNSCTLSSTSTSHWIAISSQG